MTLPIDKQFLNRLSLISNNHSNPKNGHKIDFLTSLRNVVKFLYATMRTEFISLVTFDAALRIHS